MTVNKVILVGNLGRDAEIRNTAGGTQVASLRLATTDRQKNQAGEWTDHTEWHSVVCFGKLAELMDRFGKKGKQLYVEGRIQTREYTDKDGNKRTSAEIRVNELTLVGGKPEGQPQAAATRQQAPAPQAGGMDMDDDIPFMRHAHGAAWRAI